MSKEEQLQKLTDLLNAHRKTAVDLQEFITPLLDEPIGQAFSSPVALLLQVQKMVANILIAVQNEELENEYGEAAFQLAAVTLDRIYETTFKEP
jgi:hypothetical protein